MLNKIISFLRKDIGGTKSSVFSNKELEGKEEWLLLEKVISDALSEQRNARRWSVLFKLLTFAYLLFIFVAFYSAKNGGLFPSASEGHVAVVNLHGPIMASEQSNANYIAAGLRKAFEHKKTKAVILSVNSPGGSPVQSDYIYKEIIRLREKYPDIKLYAVIGDIGASGGYYVASAAEEIYASEASLVGSIGVTSAGFGFVEALKKLGVERRDYTSGEHKSFLDPFQPSNEEEVKFWGSVLNDTHQLFIRRVKEGRGDRLKENDKLFSGLIWGGEKALEMGLIDGFASPGQLARDVIGIEDLKDFTVRKTPFEDLMGNLGANFGMSVGKGLSQSLELESKSIQF